MPSATPHIHFKIYFHNPIVETRYENILFRCLKNWGHPEREDLPAEASEELLDWKFPQGRFTLTSPLQLILIPNRWPYNILASLVSIHYPQDTTQTVECKHCQSTAKHRQSCMRPVANTMPSAINLLVLKHVESSFHGNSTLNDIFSVTVPMWPLKNKLRVLGVAWVGRVIAEHARIPDCNAQHLIKQLW